jgi:hypothetical protein
MGNQPVEAWVISRWNAGGGHRVGVAAEQQGTDRQSQSLQSWATAAHRSPARQQLQPAPPLLAVLWSQPLWPQLDKARRPPLQTLASSHNAGSVRRCRRKCRLRARGRGCRGRTAVFK